MRLLSLFLENFRNYREAQVDFCPGLNVICGKNGQGKTNLLEAVHIISLTKSMRPGRDRDWILFDAPYSRITTSAQDDDGDTTKMEIFLARDGGRRLEQDGVIQERARDWMGCLPVVFFGPQELDLVRDGPSLRRRFMDMALCQMYPRYTHSLSVYKRSLEHKRKILREWREKPSLADTLPDFNLKLAQSGEVVMRERKRFTESLGKCAALHHGSISDGREILDISYAPGAEDINGIYDELERKKEHEMRSGTALVGPHRDELVIKINDSDARLYASQGQARTAALSLKLAEKEILRENLNTVPVLLLDDVLSELDDSRREYLLRRRDVGQCLMTDCRPERLENLGAGKTIYVESGKICI